MRSRSLKFRKRSRFSWKLYFFWMKSFGFLLPWGRSWRLWRWNLAFCWKCICFLFTLHRTSTLTKNKKHQCRLNVTLLSCNLVSIAKKHQTSIIKAIRFCLLLKISVKSLFVSYHFKFTFQAQAGLASTTEFLKLAEQFRNETNYTVWNDLTANLSNLAKLLQNTGFYSSFQTFCVKLYEQIANKVGWDPKDGEGSKTTKSPLYMFCCVGIRVPL